MTFGNFYTVDEIAKALKVHRRTILRLLVDGKLKASKVGTQWRISQQQVDNYLANGESENENGPTAS